MIEKSSSDALVLGAGPGALAIAAALCQEDLNVSILSKENPRKPWPYTYGIWGDEVDELGISHLLEHRWGNTVSFFGEGSIDPNSPANQVTQHKIDYGLFDKSKLQNFWVKQCESAGVIWYEGVAQDLVVNKNISSVITVKGETINARLVIDATGYQPVFLKHIEHPPVAIQTCYGIVGRFNQPPVEKGQFVLMDYRCDHLSESERNEPPTFLYAMDMGGGSYFLEETSLGLEPPVSLETLRERLEKRLEHRGIKMTELQHEELGVFLPMNLPLPDLKQPILGFGGAAAMVHPASGYMVGGLLRRAPSLAKAVAKAMKDEKASPAQLARKGWNQLWPKDLRKKQALYQFGLEKLMRFRESQLREFFKAFFGLPNDQWYGFLTNTLSLKDLVSAMWTMFVKAPWNVRLGLMGMEGRELKLLWKFISPSSN